MLHSFERRNQNFCQTNLLDNLLPLFRGQIDLHLPNLNSLNVLCVVEADIVVDNIVAITVYEDVRSSPEVDGVIGSKGAPVC